MSQVTYRTLASLLILCLLSAHSHVLADKKYTDKERQAEEARMRKKVEDNLDWHIRSPKQLDGVSDAERWLFGGLNQSILLRSATGERFGVFEAFDEKKNIKTFEIRFHTKNKITDRFLIYSSVEGCHKGIDISAEQVASQFVVYTVTCSGEEGALTSPLLFDYASRNLYDLGFNYDQTANKTPRFSWQNGVYKLRWKVRLWKNDVSQLIDYKFKIRKDGEGQWRVRDLPPNDQDEGSGIFAIEKLPARPEYDLPSYVADWGRP